MINCARVVIHTDMYAHRCAYAGDLCCDRVHGGHSVSQHHTRIQLQACVYIHTDHAAIAMDVAQIPEWPVSSARVVVVLVGTTHCDCVVFDVAVSSI